MSQKPTIHHSKGELVIKDEYFLDQLFTGDYWVHRNNLRFYLKKWYKLTLEDYFKLILGEDSNYELPLVVVHSPKMIISNELKYLDQLNVSADVWFPKKNAANYLKGSYGITLTDYVNIVREGFNEELENQGTYSVAPKVKPTSGYLSIITEPISDHRYGKFRISLHDTMQEVRHDYYMNGSTGHNYLFFGAYAIINVLLSEYKERLELDEEWIDGWIDDYYLNDFLVGFEALFKVIYKNSGNDTHHRKSPNKSYYPEWSEFTRKIEPVSYVSKKVSETQSLLPQIHTVYWVPDPRQPNDINSGFIGLSSENFMYDFKRFIDKDPVLDPIRNALSHKLEVVKLVTCSALDALKIYAYYRSKPKGWNEKNNHYSKAMRVSDRVNFICPFTGNSLINESGVSESIKEEQESGALY